MSKEVFRLGELFCGPGGIACGAHRAVSDDGEMSIVHAWANDFDPDTCATYAKNICGGDGSSVYCKDVRELDIPSLGPIDAFAYGFPCNSFSNVGEHQGLDNAKFGQLYTYGVEVLNFYQPKWFLAENVSGIKSAGDGDHFKIIQEDLASAGYTLVTNLYKFEQYGVPQTRHRIIIVGIRNDLAEKGIKFKVPSPEPYRGHRDRRSACPRRAVPHGHDHRKDHLRRGARGTRVQGYLRRFRSRSSALHEDKPSYTVTAAGGGGTFMYHWSDEQRELTNRERARIQTFPDDFDFVGKYSSVRKQIGMAVPPRGAEIIFRAVLNTFAGIDYPSVEPSMS